MKVHAWSCVAALGLSCAPIDGEAALCARDSVPAATLLLPWFEASTNCGIAAERNTEFTVTNGSAESRLSRVTIWSNAAVPVLSFDMYFGGYAQQTINLRALLCNGTLPSTGVGLSEPGRHAAAESNFIGCNSGTDPAAGAPVYAALTVAHRDRLRAVLAGNPSPTDGMCSGTAPGLADTAVGYITVDAVTECNLPAHGQFGLHAGMSTANVLIGSALLLNDSQNASVALPLVAIEAASGTQLQFFSTFYGRASVERNEREPLPVAWQVDIDQRAAGSRSDLLAWRAPERAREPFACATGPATLPLPLSNSSGFGSRGWYVVDDAGKAFKPSRRNPFPLNAQRLTSAQASSQVAALSGGVVYVNFSHPHCDPLFAPQGWIGSINQTAGRFASFSEGVPVSAACDALPFDNTPPPPLRALPF